MGTTSESRLRIVIEAQNKTTGEMQKLSAELRNVARSTGEAERKNKGFLHTLGGLKAGYLAAAAAAAGFAAALKGVLDAASEGANMSRLQEATSSLAASLGSDMDEIVMAVKKASGSTLSETAIMATTGRAMMLGLSSNAEQLASLMQVAMFRGRAMGLSAEQAFSDIVTGIGRLSPMILDNLGIVVDADATYADYARTLGKSAGELTSLEKRQALLNRVLEEGNRMIEDAGGLADDAAAPYERLAAAWANVTGKIKTGLGEALAPAADFLAFALDPVSALQVQFDGLGDRVRKTTTSYAEYAGALEEAARSAGLLVNENGDLVRMVVQGSTVVEQVIVANYRWSESLYAVMQGIEAVPEDSFIEKARRMSEAASEAKWSMEELSLVMRGEVGRETERFVEAQERTAGQIAEVEAALRKLGVDPYATPEQLSQLDELNRKLLAASGSLRRMEEDAGVGRGAFGYRDGLGDRLREQGLDESVIRQVSELNIEIGTLYRQITDLGGKPFLTDEQRQQIDELQGRLQDLQQQQTDNTEEHKRNMREMIFNMTQTQMAADGLTDAEQKGLIALAEQLGLVDQETAALWSQTADWAAEISSAAEQAGDLGAAIEDIPAFKRVLIEIEAVGDTGILDFVERGGRLGAGRRGGNQPAPDFATGGSFLVPGFGGIDSQLVAFNATPGERVDITPAGRRTGGRGTGGGVTLKNYGTIIVESLEQAGYGRERL